MKRTLVIIDMQKIFEAANDPKTIREICRQILMAKRYKWNIIIVRYKLCGSIIKQIARITKGYKNCFTITKQSDDGSFDVANEIATRKLDLFLRICGVNSGQCVYDTTIGLMGLFPKCKIELVSRGCNTMWNKDRTQREQVLHDLSNIKYYKRNVRILK